jgi:hypothetical protein
MKDNNTNEETTKTNGLPELISAVIRHQDCPNWLREAIMNATVDNFDRNVACDSPEWFRMMFAKGFDKYAASNVKITVAVE